MNRLLVCISAVLLLGSAVYVANQSDAQQPEPAGPSPSSTIVVFNMPKVMKDYEKAKYLVTKLNEKRLALSTDAVKWRAECIAIQRQQSDTADAKTKEELGKQLIDLARKLEDKEREISRILNDDASKIIVSLYDEIKFVVDEIAEKNHYQIVFVYPDACTPADMRNPFFKEMKVKPKAALPIGLVPDIDITPIVIANLNEQFPPPKGAQK